MRPATQDDVMVWAFLILANTSNGYWAWGWIVAALWVNFRKEV